MTARVLIVDDIEANVKLLEARLLAEYFEVVLAYDGQTALDICAKEHVDIVLLDVMMPKMDGFEVCRRLKNSQITQQIPVVMITALDQREDRLAGIAAGADDFLTKPVDERALITRVRNLTRLKVLTDEMILRAASAIDVEGQASSVPLIININEQGRVLIVDDSERSCERMKRYIENYHEVDVTGDAQEALFMAAENGYDLVMISLNMETTDGLRLVSQLRSMERTRFLPILAITDTSKCEKLLRSLEMGVNDYVVRPVCSTEVVARVKGQIQRKKYIDHLRRRVDQNIEMAAVDGLTGVYNRRFMESHLSTLFDDERQANRSLSLMVIDIDYFKMVNDNYGHDSGDMVLKEFAKRIMNFSRNSDLVCRMGGEEFVVIMPETNMEQCFSVAERMRTAVADEPFLITNGEEIDLTISIGLATRQGENDAPEQVLKRADMAVYNAKNDGRNKVVSNAA